MPDIKAGDLMDVAMERAARRALKDWTERELDSAIREAARDAANKWVSANKALVTSHIEAERKARLPKFAKDTARRVMETW